MVPSRCFGCEISGHCLARAAPASQRRPAGGGTFGPDWVDRMPRMRAWLVMLHGGRTRRPAGKEGNCK